MKKVKDLCIKIKGASKEDRKKAIKLLKNNGFEWWNSDRFKDGKWAEISVDMKDKDFFYYHGDSVTRDDIVINLPQDFDKLKSYFEEDRVCGEIYRAQDRVVRYKCDNETFVKDVDVYSQIILRNDEFYGYTKEVFIKEELRKATPEEAQKLIEAEHENGWYYDGNDLVKIPEYVEAKEDHLDFKVGHVWRVDGSEVEDLEIALYLEKGSSMMKTNLMRCKPSTKEAYDKQNKPKLEVGKWYQNNADAYILKTSDGYNNNGFMRGGWVEKRLCDCSLIWQPADMTKVKELLIKEAERRGFKEGAKVKDFGLCKSSEGCGKIKTKIGYPRLHGDGLWFKTDGPLEFSVKIFDSETGKWAEIIKPSYEDLEKENEELKQIINDAKNALNR